MPVVDTPQELAHAHWAQLERIRSTVTAQARLTWEANGWSASPPVADLVELVLAGQALVVEQTDAFLSFAAGTATDSSTDPLGIESGPLIGRVARRGVYLEEVYARPGVVAREESIERAATYLDNVVRMDMQLAQRNAAFAHANADRRVVGWRRQINPQRGGKTCGFCIAASTRVYRKIDKLQLHPFCRCTVVEVYDTRGVGDYDVEAVLQDVYRQAGGRTDRAALGRVRLDPEQIPVRADTAEIMQLRTRVVDDPELGAVLTGARHDSVFQVA